MEVGRLGAGSDMEHSSSKYDFGFPSLYKTVLTSMTTYLGIAASLGTIIFIINWTNPAWSTPWALVAWLWFMAFNVGWTNYVKGVEDFVPYEYVRISVNYVNVILLFYLTGGAAENFWLAAVICTIGTSTTLFLATGKIRWYGLSNLLLYFVLFIWDSGFSMTTNLELLPVILFLVPVFAVLEKTASVLKDQIAQREYEHKIFIKSEIERKDAEEANKAKSIFLANMNHEIRTPLSAIVGFVDLLLHQKLTTIEQKQYLKIIDRNTKYLQSLISDILDFSKIEAGEMKANLTEINLDQEIESAIEVLQPAAQEKGFSISYRYLSEVPENIISDQTQLRQILLNIIGNAVKFTESGQVDIDVDYIKPKDTGTNDGQIRFVVKDTGCGIPDSFREKLFETFSQSDNYVKASINGAGLGLALSRKLAEALGGDIRLLESIEGKGSRFEITIGTGQLTHALISHLKQNAEIVAPEVEEQFTEESQLEEEFSFPKLSDLKVLIVEDNEDTQNLMRSILRNTDVKLTQAMNGKEAVELIEHNKENFNVVLMDLEMPVLDGYDSFMEIRKRGHQLPIIAFTANATQEVKAKVTRMGFNGFETKPITSDRLIKILESFSIQY